MDAKQSGIDETKYSLMEHLGELRKRIMRSVIAVFVTTGVALYFAPDLLDYTVRPLTDVLRARNRVDTLLVDKQGDRVQAQLSNMSNVYFRGRHEDLTQVRAFVEAAITEKRPIDLILVSAKSMGDGSLFVSDLLEGIEPSPEIAYLVANAHDPAVIELQLEGAALIPDPPRTAALARVVRRAAASAGKAATGEKLVVLSPLDPFFAYLKIALVIGLFVACPLWLYQAWQFVAPGLYANEKMIVLPVILSGSILFVGGGAFAYFAMFPLMFDVLVNQMMPASLVGTFTVDKYLSLLMTMTIAFGVVFELPLAIAVLAMVGVVTPKLLRKMRKYAVVAAFVFAAIITPTTDPLSLFMMAGPLLVFYELGIILASIVQRKRAKAEPPSAAA